MEVAAVISRQDFEAALAAARTVGASTGSDGLASILDGAWLGRISEVWDHIESALSRAFQFGADQAKEYVDAAIKAANDLVTSAGKRARAVQQELLERMQAYLSRLVDAAIAQVRSEVVIGTQTLALDGIDMGYKISIGGSLKVTITDLASLTSAGELTVSAHYAIPQL